VACAASPAPGIPGAGRPRLTVGDIFRAHGEAYRKSHALNALQRKAMRAIETCRTPVLGGRVDVCEQCGEAQVVYHSCRNRHCPTCQSLQQARWIEGRMRRLLPTDCAGSRRSRPAEARCSELMTGFHGGWALGSPS
jgi:hypothetical protein